MIETAMLEIIYLLFFGLVSTTIINVALTAVLYKNWVDKQLHK